jgi:ferredoxin
MPKVTFLNEALTVEAEAGKTIKEVADACGVNLFTGFWRSYHCKGKGRCLGSGCRVWAMGPDAALSPRTWKERIRPTNKGAVRLACQARVQGDIEVRTMPGALEFTQNAKWDPDAAPSRWLDRTMGKEAPAADGDAAKEAAPKPAKAAKPAAKVAAKPAAAEEKPAAAEEKPAVADDKAAGG